MGFEIKTAAALLALAMPGASERRREARQNPMLHAVWQAFLDRGGPVAVGDVARSHAGARDALAALDTADLIVIDSDAVRVAYPFSTGPNAFAVEVAPGVERYACCAVDALGLAPMLEQSITVRAACHHCGERFTIDVDPDGPRAFAEAMVWVAPRDACGGRLDSGL